jgi:peptide/nickel transport system substrate-binding protein
MTTQTRRRATRLFATVTAALSVGATLAACSGSGHGAGAASSGADAGVINWAYTSEPSSWDPVVVGATSATQLLSLIYEPLFTLDANGVPQPALATGYEYNSAGTAITITLRPNLTFQDGSPLDAEAVAYNVQRIQTQKNSALRALWSEVSSATVIDPTHVRLDLKETDYQIPYILANRSSLLASEKAAKADPAGLSNKTPVGSGPFKLAKLVPGTSVTVEKWDGYWDASNVHVKTVNLSFNVDPSSLVSGLQTGTYNFVSQLPAQNVALAQKAGLNVVSDVRRNWSATFLSANFNKAPFNNPKVYQAVNYAINRQAFVDQAFGLGIASAQPFPPTSPAFNPTVNSEYPYDPDKAKQLLQQAGIAPGSLTIELDYLGKQFSGAPELLQQQLQAVGITVKLTPQATPQQFYTGYYAQGDGVVKTDAFTLYGYVGRDSKLGALDDEFGPKGILNLSAPASSPGYLEARAKVLDTPLDSPNYKSVLQAATKAGVDGGSNITLYTQALPYVTGKGWSDFPIIDGSFRWNGLTVG